MRRILTSVVLLVLLFPSLAMGETMDDLVYRISDRLHYKKFTEVPFSGIVTGQYQGKMRNGKKVGPWIEYHKDGWLNKKGTYKNGKLGCCLTICPDVKCGFVPAPTDAPRICILYLWGNT